MKRIKHMDLLPGRTKKKEEQRSAVPASRTQIREVRIKLGAQDVEVYPLVLTLVQRCFKGIAEDGRMEYQDLIGEGLLAVAECIKRYKPRPNGKAVKFSTFAFFRIVGQLRDAVKKQDRFSVRNQLVAAESIDLQVQHHSELDVDISNRTLFLKVIRLIETRLRPDLATILVRSYLEELTDKEIALELGITRARVDELRTEALSKVRSQMPASTALFGTWVG